jgi:mannose-6-phosphate isomerase-like protein (cupin superfamily)
VIEMVPMQYPDCIKSLKRAKISLPGVQGWVAQGEEFQIVFFEIEKGSQVTPHSHGEQHGYVFEGEMALTVGNETRVYRSGDSYNIPKGVVHHAKFNTFVRVVDFFLEAGRYKTE